MAVDDYITLYVNGVSAVTGDNWQKPHFISQNLSGDSILFAVFANNVYMGAAGLLAVIQINYNDGTTDMVRSDASWSVTADIPDGFQFPSPSSTR